MRLRAAVVAALLAVCGLAGGCATYSDDARSAQLHVRAGNPGAALDEFDERLGTDTFRELPKDLEDDKILLLLERATILQAIGEYETSARDFIVADQRLEWLDIAAYERVDIARWIYSDDARAYRAPPHERLMLNILNMINFLALNQFQEAKVEARRFDLVDEFFGDEGEMPVRSDLRATGFYLGGVAFERSGEFDRAQRFYERAWRSGMTSQAIERRLVGLYRVSPPRSSALRSETSRLGDLQVEAELKGALRLAEYRREFLDGDTLIIVQSGLAPHKVPQRVPVGRAMVWAGSVRGSYALTPDERSQANSLVAQGLVKWVNLPLLSDRDVPIERNVWVSVDGRRVDTKLYLDVASQVVASWQAIFGPVVASAITRMITRALAGGATRVAAREAAKENPALGVVGLLASLAVEGTMAAADTPDTRSWTMLPSEIRFERLQLEPGEHTIRATVGSRTDERRVNVKRTELNLINFSRLR